MYILNSTFIVYIILYRTTMPAGYIIIIVGETLQHLNILRFIHNLNVKPIYIIYFKLNVLR